MDQLHGSASAAGNKYKSQLNMASTTMHKQACVQLNTYADNMAFTAFAHCISNRLISPASSPPPAHGSKPAFAGTSS